jgi:hypothetical protein
LDLFEKVVTCILGGKENESLGVLWNENDGVQMEI